MLKSLTDLLCKEDPNHKSVGRVGSELSEVNDEKNITEKSRMTVEIMSNRMGKFCSKSKGLVPFVLTWASFFHLSYFLHI